MQRGFVTTRMKRGRALVRERENAAHRRSVALGAREGVQGKCCRLHGITGVEVSL